MKSKSITAGATVTWGASTTRWTVVEVQGPLAYLRSASGAERRDVLVSTLAVAE